MPIKEEEYEIIDDDGILYAGYDKEETFLIWALLTREIKDLESEYRRSYTKKELLEKKTEYKCNWKGDLKLIEILNRHR